MEQLLQEQERLEKKGNLGKAVNDVQKTIDLLVNARDSISASMLCSSIIYVLLISDLKPTDPANAPMTLAKLTGPVKGSLEKINDDLKDIRGAQNKFQKALEKVGLFSLLSKLLSPSR